MGLCSKQVSSDGIDLGENFKLHSSGLIDVPKWKQTQNHQPDPLPCPRCESKNTKFCYYNNYNKSQPRHFCKACKRHWTKGGTLRNVPVGGGRKNKRLKTTTTSTTSLAADSQSRQQTQNLSLALGDQKDVFGILSQGLFGNRGNNVNSSFLGNPSALPLFQNQMPQVTFSNLDLFEIDSTSPLNSDNILVGLGSLTDTNTIMPRTTWQAQLTSSDVPGYWNWDEVDPLVSADQLNLCWDDNHDIKH